MFDLAWTELALIGVVALVVIGPKDLPEAIRGVARGIQKLRRMAGEFQSHADDLVREAKLDEVRNQIHEVRSSFNEIRNFDLRTEVERTVDEDGSIRRGFTEDPLKPASAADAPPVVTTPPPAEEGGAAKAPPAFVPPAFVPPGVAPPPAPAAAPSFVPPATAAPAEVREAFAPPPAPLPEPDLAQPAPVGAGPADPPTHPKA